MAKDVWATLLGDAQRREALEIHRCGAPMFGESSRGWGIRLVPYVWTHAKGGNGSGRQGPVQRSDTFRPHLW